MTTVDAYLKNLSPAERAEYERVRKLVQEVAPDAEEVISYGMPTFRSKKVILHFGVFKDHMSLFPGSDAMVTAVGEELKPFRSAKGTLKFTLDRPIPDSLLKKIIRFRLDSVSQD